MQRIQKKRGRPRLDYPEVDKGTKELQQKRRQLLEKGLLQDLTLAESLLGILYAHGVISSPLYEAGCFLRELGYHYRPCLGFVFHSRVSALIPCRTKASWKDTFVLSDGSDEKRTQAWRTALTVLKGAGPAPFEAVLKVVFSDQDLCSTGVSVLSLREEKNLCKGLEFLNLYLKGE